MQEFELNEPVYSMRFLEKNKYILMGLKKKINLYDQKLKYISSFSQLEDVLAYIKELWDGKILVVDSRKTVKILKLNDNKIYLEANIETADERNFGEAELITKKLFAEEIDFYQF